MSYKDIDEAVEVLQRLVNSAGEQSIKLKKQEKCECCHGEKVNVLDNGYTKLIVDCDDGLIKVSGFPFVFKIRFCPFCGRKL